MRMVEKKKKKNSQSRNWFLTLPCSEYEKSDIFEKLSRYKGFCGQQEKSESGYLHFHVVVAHSTPIRFSTMKNLFPKAHIEPVKSLRDALLYSMKEETRVSEPFSFGEMPVLTEKKRSPLERYFHEIVEENKTAADVILDNPKAFPYLNSLARLEQEYRGKKFSKQLRDVKSYYLWGSAGCGKTSLMFSAHPVFYRVTNYKHPFDEYRGEPVMVLDEFSGALPFSLLLNLLDRFPLSLPCRYQNRWAEFSEIWIISNQPLEHWYKKVQENEPERWRALLRRFSRIYSEEDLPALRARFECAA